MTGSALPLVQGQWGRMNRGLAPRCQPGFAVGGIAAYPPVGGLAGQAKLGRDVGHGTLLARWTNSSRANGDRRGLTWAMRTSRQ
jgi:hypothetical protein